MRAIPRAVSSGSALATLRSLQSVLHLSVVVWPANRKEFGYFLLARQPGRTNGIPNTSSGASQTAGHTDGGLGQPAARAGGERAGATPIYAGRRLKVVDKFRIVKGNKRMSSYVLGFQDIDKTRIMG